MNNPVYNVAEIFKALSDATRLKIIKLILAKGNNLCVGMIAHKLGISQPAVSQHLKVLKNAGLVAASRAGFHMHYNITDEAGKEYGVDIREVVRKIDIEFNEVANCELKGNKEQCDEVN
ncbi:MAG: helix-turn-helix transcriptional regulator [Spirochaetales bacterium]|nr:helix-turn-helix transcriptional regulator [Spirochaetales bacterium]